MDDGSIPTRSSIILCNITKKELEYWNYKNRQSKETGQIRNWVKFEGEIYLHYVYKSGVIYPYKFVHYNSISVVQLVLQD